jgi:hypothetical protein
MTIKWDRFDESSDEEVNEEVPKADEPISFYDDEYLNAYREACDEDSDLSEWDDNEDDMKDTEFEDSDEDMYDTQDTYTVEENEPIEPQKEVFEIDSSDNEPVFVPKVFEEHRTSQITGVPKSFTAFDHANFFSQFIT